MKASWPIKTTLIVLCILAFSPTILAAQAEKLKVVAVTTIIADVARNVGGDQVEVVSLVPPDSDVHAFEPAPDDLTQVAEADVLLVNGAGLEGFLSGLLESAASVEPVVVSNGVEMLAFGEAEGGRGEVVGALGDEGVCEEHDHAEETPDAADEADHEHGACDPHVWTDPKNVIVWARNIAEAFAAADPAGADAYRANAETYIAQLEALDAEVRDILAAVPEDKRVLVTNHEFFAYFAHAYGFRVVGTIIPSSGALSEPDPQTLAELAAVIEAEDVPAIFAEASANPALAEAVADETGVAVVTTIYSDSLSGPDGPASTYLDYLRYNATTIAEALGS